MTPDIAFLIYEILSLLQESAEICILCYCLMNANLKGQTKLLYFYQHSLHECCSCEHQRVDRSNNGLWSNIIFLVVLRVLLSSWIASSAEAMALRITISFAAFVALAKQECSLARTSAGG